MKSGSEVFNKVSYNLKFVHNYITKVDYFHYSPEIRRKKEALEMFSPDPRRGQMIPAKSKLLIATTCHVRSEAKS